jgi:hypothetical protein
MNAADATILQDEIDSILASGILGRSRSYAKLLEYLAKCSIDGHTPKELEIAAEVFGKGGDFDPNQDSLVRVYMHNLRQKLEQYGSQRTAGSGYKLSIPRGEYRLVIESQDEKEVSVSAPAEPVAAAAEARRPSAWVVALIGLLALNLTAYIAQRFEAAPSQAEQLAASPVWSGLFDDEVPILVVVGDYYIFAELDEYGDVRRLIRDFSINSVQDLDDLFMFSPEQSENFYDLGLTYLPQATASALTNLLRVIYTSDKPVRVTPMSDLSAADLKNNHVVYVGYISALDTLREFVFAASGLSVGDTYDELTNDATGEVYMSGAGMLRYDQRNYRDYGLFSTFPGPTGNQFMIVAGTRDAGVMHVAQVLADLGDVQALEERVGLTADGGPRAFEALYEVTGLDRMNIDAMLVYTSPLDFERIWRSALLP